MLELGDRSSVRMNIAFDSFASIVVSSHMHEYNTCFLHWLLSDLISAFVMLVSASHAIIAVLASASIGFWSRAAPPQLPSPCFCHCVAGSEALEKDLTTPSRFQPSGTFVDAPALSCFGGVLLGILIAVPVATSWHCLLVALRNSLDPNPEYQIRRPRALAP